MPRKKTPVAGEISPPAIAAPEGATVHLPAPNRGTSPVAGPADSRESELLRAVQHASYAQVFQHVGRENQIRAIDIIAEMRESKLYLQLAPTWEDFCQSVLRRNRREVERDLEAREALGSEEFISLHQLGVTQTMIRGAAALPEPERPKRLKSGEWEIGTERIDASGPDGLDRLVEALERRVAYHRNLAEDAASKVAEVEAEVEAKDGQIETLQEKLKQKKQIEEQQERYAELRAAATGDITRGLLMCANVLAQLGERVRVERPDPEEVLGSVRLIMPLARDLLEYASERRRVILESPELDPEKLDEVLRQMTEEEAAEAAWYDDADEDEAEGDSDADA